MTTDDPSHLLYLAECLKAGRLLENYRNKPIDFIDPTPKPFIVQIPLVEYFERMTRWKADPWQIDLCNRLQVAAENRHIKGVDQLFHAEPQLGKPLDIETQVLMGDGSYKRLGDIQVGDLVISHAGTPRKVLQVFEQGQLDCLRLFTNSSRSVVTALEHPFFTPDGWVQAQHLQIGQMLSHVAEPQTIEDCEYTKDEFELLGYFVGDGCVTSTADGSSCQANITSGDPPQRDRIVELGVSMGWGYRLYRKPGSNCDTIHFKGGVRDWLRKTGIAGTSSWTKRVPRWVLTGSQEKVAAFLGSYFSCDGTVGKGRDQNGKLKPSNVVEFSSVAIDLLRDVQKLLLRVGVQSFLSVKNGVYKGARHESHRLYFCSQDYNVQFIEKVPIFGQKGVVLKEYIRYRKTFRSPYLTDAITAIESIGKRECRCLEVEEDHTFTANDFIVHNTIVVSQHLPAWLFGHDPLFRFALAMYNTAQSEKHSKVVIRILSSALHKDIFPNRDGWLYGDQSIERGGRPVQTAVSGWYTNAGRGNEDDPGNAGQFSFNPVGLVSGLTGSGFSWLFCDDPYRSEKDAFSPNVNESIRDFLDFLESRRDIHSNLSLMFHRYAFDDAAAYCLDKGGFEYIRYASECDGDYIHPSTGERFTDPLNRQIGELISPRRGHDYYAKVKKNPRVWTSMNQGRPQAEGSEFFQVNKIQIIPAILAEQRKAECTVLVRSWDLAATEKAGDYSHAPLIGMIADGRTTFFEAARKQVESAGRDELMLATAQRDGFDVVITVPIDPGAAGQTALFHIQQLLKGYQVVGRSTSGSKEDRARPFASAVNSGDVEFISDEGLAEDYKWIDVTKKEMRDFLMSALTHDDTIDSGADGYSEAFERVSTGLVVKGFSIQRNGTDWERFNEYFKVSNTVPEGWTIYWGVKVTPEANVANSAVLVARASVNTGLKDTLFVIAEYKEFTDDFTELFDWMKTTTDTHCPANASVTIWLHPQSEAFRTTIWQKLQVPVKMFGGNEVEGITELNWYLRPTDNVNPFSFGEKASNLYYFLDQSSLQQEAFTWGFDKGVPSKRGAVMECLRMVTHSFRTYATDYTIEEKIERQMPPTLTNEAISSMQMSHEKDYALQARLAAEKRIRQDMSAPVRSASAQRLGKR